MRFGRNLWAHGATVGEAIDCGVSTSEPAPGFGDAFGSGVLLTVAVDATGKVVTAGAVAIAVGMLGVVEVSR